MMSAPACFPQACLADWAAAPWELWVATLAVALAAPLLASALALALAGIVGALGAWWRAVKGNSDYSRPRGQGGQDAPMSRTEYTPPAAAADPGAGAPAPGGEGRR